MKPATSVLATVLSVWAPSAFAQATDDPPRIEIANPNATFPAQQRALPPAEVIERGDGLYQVNCMACHGADLRGGDQGGPNLLRSTVVLNDVEGELIGELVRNGLNRMPPNTSLDEADMRAVAGYIHSVLARAERQGAPPRVEYDLDILVGDPQRGRRAFERECTQCHSAAGDLAGIAARIEDPVDLQNTWLAGRQQGRFGAGSAVTRRVTVTTADGGELSGDLVRYDDFFVALRTPAGEYRSFSRVGTANGAVGVAGDGAVGVAGSAVVSVEIEDPLRRHAELWAELDDAGIHDITAYLETLR